MFNTPFQKPMEVDGEVLRAYLVSNGGKYQSKYCVDRTQKYIIHGWLDHTTYEAKRDFCHENKISGGGHTAWLTLDNGLYLASFRPVDPEQEKLEKCVYAEVVPEEIGNKKVQATAEKVVAALTRPMTAEEIAGESGISYATVNSTIKKLIAAGVVEKRKNPTGEFGAGGVKRIYALVEKVIDNRFKM